MPQKKTDPTPDTRPEGLIITRKQPYVLLKFTCEICGKEHEIWRLPGKMPKYCPPAEGEKVSDCQRKATALRVQKHRASKQKASDY